MERESVLEKKIYYHDTDAGGVVYYGNYLKHLEEARTEYCFERGVDKRALAAAGILFVVAHLDIEYRAPARYLDVVQVRTTVQKLGRSAVVFLQTVRRGTVVLVEAKVTAVCVGADFRARALPPQIRAAFGETAHA
ncbi:MAG: acyl-CoA thioesterase [Candidatus Omnitrophica bacterium]|nr:acyl-CoA thioesterase [Candidatus Omnitrophota bacterium]